ncbi:hypothetical protein [Nocardia sp. IFM 10818]
MPVTYNLMHLPLQLLARNEFDTEWNVLGCFAEFGELISYIRESKLSRVRKRIVQVSMSERREPGVPRYLFTTIWEGTRLPPGIGRTHPVNDAEYPRNYDKPTS